MESTIEADGKVDHLCVLVHGLWGNPSHLDYIASAIQDRHGKSGRIHILAAQRNSGTYTYDGIELGGERVANEIEDTLEQLSSKQGCKITKLSIVGYSLGGLVARYAIGLLEANGYLDEVQAVNFTTFASPHVGVRTPMKGLQSHIWNVLGARTISMSGRQLFMIDDFRGTGKPLLSILADPNSIFMRGLAKFKQRSVYANIVNDRSTVFYTTAISKIDPFATDLEKTQFNYVKGYDQVIIDPDRHILPPEQQQQNETEDWIFSRIYKLFIKLSLGISLSILLPIASVVFLVNSVVQNVLSQHRIKLYEQGKTDLLPSRYRIPLIIQDMRGAMEDAFENLNASQPNEYLSERDGEEYISQVAKQQQQQQRRRQSGDYNDNNDNKDNRNTLGEQENGRPLQQQTEIDAGQTHDEFPLLALTPAQFEIIDSLNEIGFKKYPVYIHNALHSHAAIIVRMPKARFSEGKIVVKHWLDHGFYI